MKYLLTFILSWSIIGCTTVNVYPNAEPIIVIKPTIKNSNNPYLREDYVK